MFEMQNLKKNKTLQAMENYWSRQVELTQVSNRLTYILQTLHISTNVLELTI